MAQLWLLVSKETTKAPNETLDLHCTQTQQCYCYIVVARHASVQQNVVNFSC